MAFTNIGGRGCSYCLPSEKLKHTYLQTFVWRHKVTMGLREKVRNNISVFGSSELWKSAKHSGLFVFSCFLCQPDGCSVLLTVFLHCHLIKRITICKGYQPEARVMRERLLFIHIRVAHSGALGTAINWDPDKIKMIQLIITTQLY